MSHVVVVGDALLDVDLVGTASRLTPDAPVPVVEDVDRRERPGGAALAAVIAAQSGADVTLVTPLGDDDGARRLRALLEGRVRLIEIPATSGTPSHHTASVPTVCRSISSAWASASMSSKRKILGPCRSTYSDRPRPTGRDA